MLNTTGQAALIALAVFLISLIALTWYNQGLPPFSHGEVGEGQAQGAVQGEGNAQHYQQPSQRASAEQGGANPKKEERSSQECVSKKEETDAALATYTFWLTAFTAILAVATFGLVIATVGLWWYASEQAGDMKSAINQSRRSADASQASVKISQDTAIRQLRPYLVATLGGIDINSGTAIVKITNRGQTPATNVVAHARFDITERSIGPNAVYKYISEIYNDHLSRDLIEEHIVGPGESIDIYKNIGNIDDIPKTIISNTSATDRNGLSYIVYGEIKYKDAFGFSRNTLFFHRYSGKNTGAEAGRYFRYGNIMDGRMRENGTIEMMP